MKLYTFDQGGYCTPYHVLANSKEEALEYIKQYCISRDVKDLQNKNKQLNGQDSLTFPIRYQWPSWPENMYKEYQTLEEYLTKDGYHYRNYLLFTAPDFVVEERNIGEVLQTEVS